MDRRRETLTEIHSRGNEKIIIDPDIIADFTRLPFLDNSFVLVVMDPPHVPGNTITGNITKRYGILRGDWKEMLRQGFAECFRVLKPHGTFILKWSSVRVPLKEILPLAKPQKPLFGSLSGLKMNTYWVAFLKRQIEREL
jgi:SAM-dependent methyltransferase